MPHKKSVHDGVKASYARMSPIKGDVSQGAFLDISEISQIDISCIIRQAAGGRLSYNVFLEQTIRRKK